MPDNNPAALLQSIEGWEGLDLNSDKLNDINKENQAAADEWAQRIYRVFMTDSSAEDGRAVLERLIQITVLRPTVMPHSTQFEAGIKEGRCDIVREILSQIEYSQKL